MATRSNWSGKFHAFNATQVIKGSMNSRYAVVFSSPERVQNKNYPLIARAGMIIMQMNQMYPGNEAMAQSFKRWTRKTLK